MDDRVSFIHVNATLMLRFWSEQTSLDAWQTTKAHAPAFRHEKDPNYPILNAKVQMKNQLSSYRAQHIIRRDPCIKFQFFISILQSSTILLFLFLSSSVARPAYLNSTSSSAGHCSTIA
uniref:Uncharacterized protein n=1 Tax=Glossina pallidipes TaxID=7398 RepID=A0A1A9ZCV4_GLOPL